MQMVGLWQLPVAYPSKQLDTVASGGPLSVDPSGSNSGPGQRIRKLTLGQNMNEKVPHAVTALMSSQGHKWLAQECPTIKDCSVRTTESP